MMRRCRVAWRGVWRVACGVWQSADPSSPRVVRPHAAFEFGVKRHFHDDAGGIARSGGNFVTPACRGRHEALLRFGRATVVRRGRRCVFPLETRSPLPTGLIVVTEVSEN